MEKSEKIQIFSTRLKSLRLRRGLNQAQLAETLGFSTGAVGNWEAGANIPSPQKMRKIADFFAVSIGYLLGEDDEGPPSSVMNDALSPSGLPASEAPVVSWASAGRGGDYSDLAEFLEERVLTDCKDPNKYALIVEGDSMVPEFKPGDRIVVAPNEEPRNGEEVVARLRDSGRVFFKIYHETANGRVLLTSYNPAFPPLEFAKDDFRFIQPVYELVRKRRHIRR